MADIYASAVGTTVLQIKEIPERPKEFDGLLCLFGLKRGVDEATVRRVFGNLWPHERSKIAACKLEAAPPVVQFFDHDDALLAKDAGANLWTELCDSVDTLYNERSYTGRDPNKPDKHTGGDARNADKGRGW
jgi:hypothetical protein|eukprot:180654-Prymnesium_polylepis.2